MREYTLYQVNSFTKEKFTGNPAGVIINSDGLSEFEMKKIAQELKSSEPTFVFSSNCNDYDVEVRYFTPTKEVCICDRATIAAHYVRTVQNKLKLYKIYHNRAAGILPV